MNIRKIKHEYKKGFSLEVENLEIPSNKIIGLVGENGAGKTTLMSILSGFMKANKVYEVETEKKDFTIGFIPSEIKIYDFLTVEEFVKLFVDFSSTEMSVDEIISLLEMEEKRKTSIDELSQGMQKKLTLIPIMTKKYDLIILDEPFNSIDVKYIYKLKQLLQNIKQRATILISSHILDTLVDLCDDFIVLDAGRVKDTFENTKTITDMEERIFEGSN
ncbi:ATP-binding cassette domain-containing protein [Lachnobacterium bovis]|uniref:ABC-2 type transport system ATP-binding protein n=1 Tax=Lachnobacterium bovis DSM 14045 TaxID=1122142 RepID=A0A1H3KTS3_9FIRM|nr:ABC transporter ATP-binding protein [Lachnobacterium bovis]SDY55572.1 ABC-2 type transport system ATP-binding protein [Lachnobacterium bovis DSM 14045]